MFTFSFKICLHFFFAARSSVSGAVDVSETSERIGIRTAEHKEIHALISYKGMYNPVIFFLSKEKISRKFATILIKIIFFEPIFDKVDSLWLWDLEEQSWLKLE